MIPARDTHSNSHSHGLFDSLRGIGDALLNAVQDRVSLFALEIEEEKHRFFKTLAWLAAACFAGVMALTFASLVIVAAFWDKSRLGALAALAVFYSVALGAVLAALRRHLARQSRPFNATLSEIVRDRACIRREE